jgi:hypothetical protein
MSLLRKTGDIGIKLQHKTSFLIQQEVISQLRPFLRLFAGILSWLFQKSDFELIEFFFDIYFRESEIRSKSV